MTASDPVAPADTFGKAQENKVPGSALDCVERP